MTIRPVRLLTSLAASTLVLITAVQVRAQNAGPPQVQGVQPGDVLPDEATFVWVTGDNFTNETRITFPGAGDLVDPFALIDEETGVAQIIGGYTPILPQGDPHFPVGWKDVVASDARGTTTVQHAFYYVDFGRPYLKYLLEPTEIPPEAGTRLKFFGRNFREGVKPRIDGIPCTDITVVDETLIECTAPDLPFDPDVMTRGGATQIYESATGELLSERYVGIFITVGARPPRILSVDPAEADARGGTPISIHGESFREDTVVMIGDILTLEDRQVVSSELITGIARGVDPLDLRTPPGLNDILVMDRRGRSVLPGGILYVDKIRAVSPTRVSSRGGEAITFEGFGFEEGLTPRLGVEALLDVTRVGTERIEGTTPPMAPGVYHVSLTDEAGSLLGYLPGAVEVVLSSPPVDLPAPAEIEAVFAEGQARFTWSNPIAYDRIVATELLADGAIGRAFELVGTETQLLVPATREGIALELKGFFDERLSAGALGYAYPARCGQPAPLGGYGTQGTFDFPLFGGNLPRFPGRCLPLPAAHPGGQGGGLAGFDLAAEWASINGFQELGEGYGVTARNQTLDLVLAAFGPHRYSNRLVTGFTLGSDADRLQIEAFYQKTGEAPGLALMGRLVHVFPADGFEDEFTFPDAAPGDDPGWHGFTYFRADRDVAEAEAQPCNLKIPGGDYILQIYAINGEPDQSYYSFRDDGRDVELLIPGAPCPPYPLVQVRDVSGKRTIPNVTDIQAAVKGPNSIELRAIGSWFDGVSPVPHSIEPGDASYVPHNFEFVWTIENTVPSTTRSSFSSNRIVVPVSVIGCHRVHLTVRDLACDREATVTRQAIVEPQRFACTARPYVVQDPTPDPSGIRAIAGLSPGPGQGRMTRGRELSLRVLISAESLDACGGDSRVVAPDVGDLQFRFVWSYVNPLQFPPLPEILEAVPPGEVRVTNLCRSVTNSPYTYFELVVPDLGVARPLPVWADNGVFQAVKLQWNTVKKRVARLDGSIGTEPGNDPLWHDVAPALWMTNPPRSLGQNYWQGFYSEPEQRYRFIHQTSDNYQSHFALGKTRAVPLELPAGGPNVKVPAMDNSFGAGLNTTVELVNGKWRAGVAKIDEGGEILSNKVQGGPLQIDALPRGRGGSAGGAGAQANLKDAFRYAWCHQQEIFNKTHEQQLFNALVFAGVIPPGIPITVWASIGLALKVSVTAQAGVLISLFEGLEGGSFVKSDLYFNSELGLHFPASIRADLLYGVASVAFKLRPSVNALFRVHVGNKDLELVKEANLSLFVKLAMEVEVCVLSFLKEIPIVGDALCTEVLKMNILNAELINVGDPVAFEECPDGDGFPGLGAASQPEPEGGAAGGDIRIQLEEYFPATRASRDGSVTLDVAYEKSDVSTIRAPRMKLSIKVGDRPRELFSTRTAWELEPSIGFLSNRRALIASTRSFPQDAIDAGAMLRPDQNYTSEELSFFRAHDEIVITPAGETARPNFWDVAPDFILSDPRDEVPDAADRRVDGRAAVAGDETHEDALVAWVRIDDPQYFFQDPATQQPRLHIEKTAIFARAVDFNGVLDISQRVSAGGINVEPSVAFSPSGNFAYCVWVNDPVHLDLLGSNRGRNLLYSIYERATRTWRAPQPIFADPDSHPGMLEPNISLRGDDYGLLAFTALDASAEEKDTGLLGGNRHVFISRLIDGVFGPPVLVHGKCEKRIYGSKVVIEIPPRGQDPLSRALNKWEWQVLFQQAGSPLSLESAGGLMVSGLLPGAFDPTPAVAVLADGNVRSNVVAAATATGIHAVSLNLGSSLRVIRPGLGLGAGGGIEPLPEGAFESTDILARPDLSIASCALSNRYSGPGALVTARVKIENDGLLASAVDERGESRVGLQVLFIDAAGAERVVATSTVPSIDPGDSTEITLTLEQPLDPVRVWMTLGPNPLDANASNDSIECFLGAPAPRDFACELVEAGGGESDVAALLTWRNTGAYDEILLYRDGSMLAAIPGAATSFVDRSAAAGPHGYELRARIESSKSSRAQARCTTEQRQVFRRGDADANGRLEITDAVVTLGFLFLGGRAPACFDGADTDDSGVLGITDPIRLLNYLFIGGAAPSEPGPLVCGEDPTGDDLACDASSPGC